VLYSDYLVSDGSGDHSIEGSGNPGSYKVLKNNYLLAEDFPGSNPAGLFDAGYTAGFTGSGSQSNYIQLGDDSTLGIYVGEHTIMPRVYDANDSAAYAMVDATKAYTNSPTRVYRHITHLKKPGTQDFVVVYDDISTPVGVKKTTFLQYANNGMAPRGRTSSSGGLIVSSYPGTGHGDATQLLTEVFSPAGPLTVAVTEDGGAYPGAGGNAYRFSICASADGKTCDAANTNAEFLVVHMPVLGTGNSMPPVTDISGPSFAGVQIGGTSPKVFLFPRNGQSYTSSNFVATHTGTAQIAVAGLRPGTYEVTQNSNVLASVAVGADGLLYFEGTSGSYSIASRAAAGFRLQAGTVLGGAVR